jgi:hypothetical protein
MEKKTPFTFELAMLKAESYVGRKEKLLRLIENSQQQIRAILRVSPRLMGELANIPSHDPSLGDQQVLHASRLDSHGGGRRSVFCQPI